MKSSFIVFDCTNQRKDCFNISKKKAILYFKPPINYNAVEGISVLIRGKQSAIAFDISDRNLKKLHSIKKAVDICIHNMADFVFYDENASRRDIEDLMLNMGVPLMLAIRLANKSFKVREHIRDKIIHIN